MNRFGLLLALILSRIATAATLPIAEVHKSAKVGETVEIQGTVTAKGAWHVCIHDGTAGIAVYDTCRTELRNCLWDLRNDAFDGGDVSAIIRKAIAPHLGSASANVKLDLQRSHISDSTFHALLCIIRELVINAVRHGTATQIDIRGEMTATALKITVRDNGCGFDPTSRRGPAEGHFGLLGIQERLDRLGGALDIISSPGHGAEFTISVES